MNPEQAKMFLNFFITSFEAEVATTKKVLERVPDSQKTYRPDPKSMSAHDLAWHIPATEVWFLDSLLKGKFEMGQPDPAPATIAEILSWYEKNVAALLPKVKAMPADNLSNVINFFGMQHPAVMYLSFMLLHSIHHRGQLSAYLRPMGAKVPSIYGGSADEPFQAEAASGH